MLNKKVLFSLLYIPLLHGAASSELHVVLEMESPKVERSASHISSLSSAGSSLNVEKPTSGSRLRRRRLNLGAWLPDPTASSLDDPHMQEALDTVRERLERRVEKERRALTSTQAHSAVDLVRSIGLSSGSRSSDHGEDDDEEDSINDSNESDDDDDERISITRDELLDLVATSRATHALTLNQERTRILREKELKEMEEELEAKAKRDRCLDIGKNVMAVGGTIAGLVGGVLGIISITACS